MKYYVRSCFVVSYRLVIKLNIVTSNVTIIFRISICGFSFCKDIHLFAKEMCEILHNWFYYVPNLYYCDNSKYQPWIDKLQLKTEIWKTQNTKYKRNGFIFLIFSKIYSFFWVILKWLEVFYMCIIEICPFNRRCVLA